MIHALVALVLAAQGEASPPTTRLVRFSSGAITEVDEHWRKVRVIPAPVALNGLTLSPDHRTAYFIQDGQVRALDLKTLAARSITRHQEGITGFRLSPDGQFIAYDGVTAYVACCGSNKASSQTMLWIQPAAGGAAWKVPWPPPGVDGSFYPYSMLESWVPGGTHAVIQGTSELESDGNYWLLNLRNRTVGTFDLPGGAMPDIHFSPSGQYLVHTSHAPPEAGKPWSTQVILTEVASRKQRTVLAVVGGWDVVSVGPGQVLIAGRVGTYPSGQLQVVDQTGRVILDAGIAPARWYVSDVTWAPNGEAVAWPGLESGDRMPACFAVGPAFKVRCLRPVRGDVRGLRFWRGALYYTEAGPRFGQEGAAWSTVHRVNLSTASETNVCDGCTIPVEIPADALPGRAR